jgi:hypothetical protein
LFFFFSPKTQINGDVKAADVKFSVQNEKVVETGNNKSMAKSPLLTAVQKSSLELEKILTGTILVPNLLIGHPQMTSHYFRHLSPHPHVFNTNALLLSSQNP